VQSKQVAESVSLPTLWLARREAELLPVPYVCHRTIAPPGPQVAPNVKPVQLNGGAVGAGCDHLG
jgi:hypothetical protein